MMKITISYIRKDHVFILLLRKEDTPKNEDYIVFNHLVSRRARRTGYERANSF